MRRYSKTTADRWKIDKDQTTAMQCYVYRSSKIDGLYVYMTEENRLDLLPAQLKKQLGNAELALSFKLHPDRPLTSEDPAEVISNLGSVGFHVQMPPKVESSRC